MKSCNQCGKCCIKYGGNLGVATGNDLEVWELEKPELLDFIYSENLPDIWISPTDGEELNHCPWLYTKTVNKYACEINDVRPTVCRNYPVSIEQMKKDECEMLECIDKCKTDDELMCELIKLKRTGNSI